MSGGCCSLYEILAQCEGLVDIPSLAPFAGPPVCNQFSQDAMLYENLDAMLYEDGEFMDYEG